MSTTQSTLEQLRDQLFEIDPSLSPQSQDPIARPALSIALEKLSNTLTTANATYLSQARTLYQALTESDLATVDGKALLKRLKANLTTQLQDLDDTCKVGDQGRKQFLTYTAGISALEQEAQLNVQDLLLSPSDQRMIEDCSLGPSLRPGMYALTFSYQAQTVVFAGAFVLTRQHTPTVSHMDGGEHVGPVILFSPSRGIEAFETLRDLDQGLKTLMTQSAGREEFTQHLPVGYQHLDVAGIWPLELQPIEDMPLFEHTYQALLDKRALDINLALNQANEGQHTARQLYTALDAAIVAALPDLSPRLDLRAQRVLELALHNALPDWYRNAELAQRQTLDEQALAYNQARQSFIDLIGPAATPQALARFELVARLADDLDIHDLEPDQLHLVTQRQVNNVGSYEQRRSLVELTLRGLHTGDEKTGSAFLTATTLTYEGNALTDQHAGLTPQSLLTLIQNMQPRVDFATVQQAHLGKPEIKQAARSMLDARLVLLARVAQLQGHLNAADHQRFEQLRANLHPHLRAHTVLLHGAQLKDLWVLRDEQADGQIARLLLCTPEAPRDRQFIAFNSLRECQTHILGWADDPTRVNGRSMSDYLIEQVPLRFRPKMQTFLKRLGFKPAGEEHTEVTFGPSCTHAACLDAMVMHLLDGELVDDYEHGTPLWYRSAAASDINRLTSLSEDAAGALHTYNQRPDAEANLTTFNEYLHAHARLSLNALLGRAAKDVDPDSVFAYSPKPLVGRPAAPISYTQLYRDGYEDGIGFIDEKFSTSATFRGPPGVDLSTLTAKNVARSVTGVWIGERYTQEVRKRVQDDHAGYAERRHATLAIVQLQMKSAALESRLQGHIASIDLDWLEQAIDSLPQSAVSTRNLYKIHRLFIDGEWVIGNYLFSHADDPVLLYTPNAPDGIGFREAKLFNYLLKQVEGMLAYFCERVAVQSQTRVRQFLQEARQGLPDDINRTTPSPARHDVIARVPPLTDLPREFYNMSLQRKIDDVLATTVNRTQMITGILWTCVEWVTAIATIPFPALSLAVGGLLAFKDAMLALSAYRQGDKDSALQHYIGYLANLGGAVLFDMRPALKGLPTRPVIKAGKQALDAAALSHLDPIHPPGMQPVLFNGESYWAPLTPDPLGRYLLYRLDPQTQQLRSTARLVNKDTQGRWVRSGYAAGGRKDYEPLLEEADNPLAIYEIEPGQGKNLRAILNPAFQKNHGDWAEGVAGAALNNAHAQLAPLRNAYPAQVTKLTADADQFFQAYSATATPLPLPTLAIDTPHATILGQLFTPNKQLIIGALNDSIASKQLLIDNMQTLAQQGLKRLYIENLPRDAFRTKLMILNGEIKGNVARALQRVEEHLAQVDQALGFDRDAPFSYRTLLLQARRHQVAIEGVDGACSYHLEHVLNLAAADRLIPRTSKLRNFYSHKVLESATRKSPDEGWIALVEHDRIGSYEQLPGLAALQKTPALHVQDAAPGQPLGVLPDATSAAQSRGDFQLSIQTLYHTRAKPASASTPVATHFSDFDIAPELRQHIERLTYSSRGMDSRYGPYGNDPSRAAFNAFLDIRQRLRNKAKAFFADYTPGARSSLTALDSAASESDFIKTLYQQRSGLVIGEIHSHESSKVFLIKHMKLLQKQGVKTLYVEHVFTDLHQAHLDTFHNTSKMPTSLQQYMNFQDRNHMYGYQGPNTFTNVFKAANKYGIRIRALDCTASYHLKGISESRARYTMFSYFAHHVINADQATTGAHKWVALMGNGHTDLQQLVPGIAQMQDAVSLHIRDVPPGKNRALHRNGWERVGEGLSDGTALRSDFRINVATPGKREFVTPMPDRARLRLKGHFLIEHPSGAPANLVHHSSIGEIVTTPIQIDERGQFFIERWDAFAAKRFILESQLIRALETEIGLVRAP